jgi:hypothetical protein
LALQEKRSNIVEMDVRPAGDLQAGDVLSFIGGNDLLDLRGSTGWNVRGGRLRFLSTRNET